MAIGDTIKTTTGIELTANAVELRQHIDTSDGPLVAASDSVFVLAKIRAKNVSDEVLNLPSPSDFDLIVNETQHDPWGTGFSSRRSLDLDRPEGLFEQVEDAHNGITASGWLVFEIPRPDVLTVTVAYASETILGEDRTTVYWDASIDPGAVARFETLSVSAPEEVELGSDIEFTATFENGGERPAVTRFEYTLTPITGFPSTERARVTVPPGETVTKTVTTSPVTLGTVQFESSIEDVSVDVVPARLSMGETFTLADQSFTLQGAVRAGKIKHTEPIATEPTTLEADSGNEYLLVKAVTDGISPPTDSIRLVEGDSTYPPLGLTGDLESPRSGETYASGFGPSTGWLVFEVPTEVNYRDASIRARWENFTSSGTAYWSL